MPLPPKRGVSTIRRVGLVMRLIGPLIEFPCLFTLLAIRGEHRTFLKFPVEPWLMAGVVLGISLIIVGLFLSYFLKPPPPKRMIRDLDLGETAR